MSEDGEKTVGRRRVLGLIGAASLAAFAPRAVEAAEQPIGTVEDVTGKAYARLTDTRLLTAQEVILLGDFVWTTAAARARLGLEGGTTVNLGPKARLKIDRFVAEAGGSLTLGDGAVVIDRPGDLPKIDLTVRSTYGLIGVRGTRFFAGPSRGRFGVFVEHGTVTVSSGGLIRRVGPGEGVDIRAPQEEPGPVTRWGQARIDEALASVFG